MDDTRGKIPETICKNDLIKKTDQHRAGKTLPGASLFRKRIPLYRSEPARKKRSLETVAPLLEAVQVSHEVITQRNECSSYPATLWKDAIRACSFSQTVWETEFWLALLSI